MTNNNKNKLNSFNVSEFEVFKTGVIAHYGKSNPQAATLLLTLAFTGMRKGEALALRWNSVDFNNKTIKITEFVTLDADDKLTISRGKTKYSIRTIGITDELVKLLLAWKNHQQSKCKDKEFSDNSLIFQNINGSSSILSPAKPDKWLNVIENEYHLPNISVQGLRHTYAELLIRYNISPNFVASTLGRALTLRH